MEIKQFNYSSRTRGPRKEGGKGRKEKKGENGKERERGGADENKVTLHIFPVLRLFSLPRKKK